MMMCCITLNHGWHDVTVWAARARGALIACFSWHWPCSLCWEGSWGISRASVVPLCLTCTPPECRVQALLGLTERLLLGWGWTSLGQVWVWTKHRGMGRSGWVSPLLPPGWQRSCRILLYRLTFLGSPGEGGSSMFKFLRSRWSQEWLLLSGLSAALHSDKTRDTWCQ